MNKETALEVAQFLDSPQASALGLSRSDLRRIAEPFVAASYEELGKAPRLLDGQDVHALLGHSLPGHFDRKDPLAERVPAVIGAFFDHLERTQVVTQAFEIRQGLATTAEEILTAVRTGRAAHHAPRQEPVVYKVAKLGRNDPCSCGSGKKYKKCHGKN